MVFTHTKIFKTSFLGASYCVWFNQTIKTSKRKEWLEMYQLDHDASIVIYISNNDENSSNGKQKIRQ